MNVARHLQFPCTDETQLFDVDNFLDELDQLARQGEAPEDFYCQFLDSATLAIGATSGTFWKGEFSRIRPIYHHGRDSQHSAMLKELDAAWRTGEPQVVTGDATRGPILACAVRGVSTVTGLLTFELSPGTLPVSAAQLLDLAVAIAESAGEYEQRQQVAAAGNAAQRLANVEHFLLRVHGMWRADEIARELAEEGRRLVGCDRFSVLLRSGRSWHVAAVSGVDSPSSRAAAIRSMERLVRVVAATGELWVVSGGPNDFPPQVQQALDDYFTGTAPRQLVVKPCAAPISQSGEVKGQPTATAVIEQFQGELPSGTARTLQTLTEHAAIAILRANAVGRIPFASWLLQSGQSAAPRRWPRRALLVGAIATVLAGVVAALLWMPANLEISAEGRFAPTSRMRVFAPRDAIVQQVLVTHGAKVKRDQPLIELRSPELELQIEQVQGELATARKEMAALETARLRATLPNQKVETDVGSVAAKLAALRELTTSHERRLELLEKESLRLNIVSPTDGEVLSWKPEDYLRDRPVRRGQRLLEIGDTAGDWEIELDVPDRRAGHVLAAAQADSPLSVSYIVKSDPARQHFGKVKGIAAATQADAEGNPALRVEVRPENAKRVTPRSGMMVSANIHCGERSLGYVWFHEAWEAIQRYWF